VHVWGGELAVGLESGLELVLDSALAGALVTVLELALAYAWVTM
jgi:hypothetical protein